MIFSTSSVPGEQPWAWALRDGGREGRGNWGRGEGGSGAEEGSGAEQRGREEGDSEAMRTMLELVSQLDGFRSDNRIKSQPPTKPTSSTPLSCARGGSCLDATLLPLGPSPPSPPFSPFLHQVGTMLELLSQLDGFSSDDRIKMVAATNRADILDLALMRPERHGLIHPHSNPCHTVSHQVVAATNRADILDPALMRSGRLDRKIEFPHPTEEARARILQVR
ncbi:unnamed protein product [Closterium sp. NIES-64]|nr:unnamed protein product [Closterium sp. NIES-64]